MDSKNYNLKKKLIIKILRLFFEKINITFRKNQVIINEIILKQINKAKKVF